jgi:FkbM family methyltransferase
MEGIRAGAPIIGEIVKGLMEEHVTVIDIGCSFGIDAPWREFGNRLRAFGFDPNIEEVKRLQAAEKQTNIEYIAAHISESSGDGGATHACACPSRNPWARLSVAETLKFRAAKTVSNKQKTELNDWTKVQLADSEKPVVLTEFLRDRNVDDVDFVKIDVDGADFSILRSLQSVLSDSRVLGICIEVNYFGSDDPDTNSFHNVDRFLKSAGFELFDITCRRYSTSALPAPYVYSVPAQSLWGRVLQGDAIYFRDLAAPLNTELAGLLKPAKLAKLVALFAMFGLPDCAAEILVMFGPRLTEILNVQKCLETLVQQAAPDSQVTYGEYMRDFNSDGPRFYPPLPRPQRGSSFMRRFFNRRK